MAKIKHTKTELKAQTEALRRYQRFLPMLQLKKQQLQVEIQSITNRMEEVRTQEEQLQKALEPWQALMSEPVDLDQYVILKAVNTEEGNIAGVSIPVFKQAEIETPEPDLFATPPWLDDAQETFRELIALQVQHEILEEQRRLVTEELQTTSQRVNLFEKVKIPECRENIRVIKIYLGDEQTSAVARGKIAKRRSDTAEAAA